HVEKDEEQEASLFQRRRARKKTDFQPMGAALAARSAARIREEPMHEAAPSRRTRFARVEGTSQDIVSQLGLGDGGSPMSSAAAAAAAAAADSARAPSGGRSAFRSRRSVITPIDADSLQIPLLSGGGGGEGVSSSPVSLRTPRVSVGYGDGRRSVAVSGTPSVSSSSFLSPRFVRDSPGRPVLQGSDLFVQWIWPESPNRPEHVFLGLFYHHNEQFIFPLHWSKPIPNTGSFAWHVDTRFRKGEACQLVFLGMFDSEIGCSSSSSSSSSSVSAADAVCQSNAFYIVKPTPLCELELRYASFCRTHGLEMEHMSESKLSEFGYSIQECMLKVCIPFCPYNREY
ncbi:hypothetical protein, conserved, partial [Eimeria maxima]